MNAYDTRAMAERRLDLLPPPNLLTTEALRCYVGQKIVRCPQCSQVLFAGTACWLCPQLPGQA